MNPFAYESTKDPAAALKAVGATPGAMFLADAARVRDAVAAAEAAVGLAMVIAIYRTLRTVNVDEADTLKG